MADSSVTGWIAKLFRVTRTHAHTGVDADAGMLVSHADLLNVGTYTHAQIDAYIASQQTQLQAAMDELARLRKQLSHLDDSVARKDDIETEDSVRNTGRTL